MQVVRRSSPSLPVLMFTVQHSEAIAVWALRARLWNYYVKPVDEEELMHDLAELAEVVRTGWKTKVPYWPAQSLPSELPVHGRRDRYVALRPALAYVKQRFHEQVRETEVAERCGLTRFEFSRAFHKAFGLTYIDYVLKLRIRAAQRLLRTPGARASEVCFKVGVNDPSYFGRIFRRHNGMSPARWAQAEQARAAETESPTGSYQALRGDIYGPIAP